MRGRDGKVEYAEVPPYTHEDLERLFYQIAVSATRYNDPAELKNYYDGEIKALISRLIGESPRFKKIFQTASGSVYFVFHNNYSQRVKPDKNGVFYRLSDMTQSLQVANKNIFCISREEYEKFKNFLDLVFNYRNFDLLMDETVQVSDIQLGGHPLELNSVENLWGQEYDVQLEHNKGAITFRAPQINGRRVVYDNRLPGGIHIGSRITTIKK